VIWGVDGHVDTIRQALLAVYPAEHEIRTWDGHLIRPCPLASLRSAQAVYIPPLDILQAVREADALIAIAARLRAPGGCPWDRSQTHESLKPYLIEESYEVLEALDHGQRQELVEELGDLLLQVLMHSQIASEAGEFNLRDVLAHVSSKLIRRHPHVFGQVEVQGVSDVLRNWEQIKADERASNGAAGDGLSILSGIPSHLPALAYAQAVQERASRAGFGWPDIESALGDVMDELGELLRAKDEVHRRNEFGDVLFALVQVARWLKINAEDALRQANRRYRERIFFVEDLCRQRGMTFHTLSREERARLWEEAKGYERNSKSGSTPVEPPP